MCNSRVEGLYLGMFEVLVASHYLHLRPCWKLRNLARNNNMRFFISVFFIIFFIGDKISDDKYLWGPW